MRNGSSGPRRAVNCATSLSERRRSRRRRLARRLVRRRGSCQLTETRGNTGWDANEIEYIYGNPIHSNGPFAPLCTDRPGYERTSSQTTRPKFIEPRQATHLCPAGIDQQSLCCYPVKRGSVRTAEAGAASVFCLVPGGKSDTSSWSLCCSLTKLKANDRATCSGPAGEGPEPKPHSPRA